MTQIPKYEHVDVLWGKSVDKVVIPEVLRALERYAEKPARPVVDAGKEVNGERQAALNGVIAGTELRRVRIFSRGVPRSIPIFCRIAAERYGNSFTETTRHGRGIKFCTKASAGLRSSLWHDVVSLPGPHHYLENYTVAACRASCPGVYPDSARSFCHLSFSARASSSRRGYCYVVDVRMLSHQADEAGATVTLRQTSTYLHT